jgi:hypothetical protein
MNALARSPWPVPAMDYEFSVPLAGGMIETYLAARFV